MVHVLVGWDGETDQPYVSGPAAPGDADGIYDVFEADVPVEVWARFEAASKDCDEALNAVVAVSGVCDDGRLVEPCAEWKGDVCPAHRWWTIEVARADDSETWPQLDVEAGHFDSHLAAEQFLTSLPDSIHVLNQRVWAIPKADLRVVGPRGWPESVSECERCGWARDEHDEPAEAPA